MIFFNNDDAPGVLYAVTQVLAHHAINIGCFGLGRTNQGTAVGVLNVDDTPSSDAMLALSSIQVLTNVKLVHLLDMPTTNPILAHLVHHQEHYHPHEHLDSPPPLVTMSSSSRHSKMKMPPLVKPKSILFGSGPCKKHSQYALANLPTRTLGRSHRSKIGKKVRRRNIFLFSCRIVS